MSVREERLVVILEVDVRETARLSGEGIARDLLTRLRTAADAKAAEVHAEVRTDKLPALDFKRGTNPSTGQEMWLCWSNWYVWVPTSQATRLDVEEAP